MLHASSDVYHSCTDHGEDKSNNGARDLELVCALYACNPHTGQGDPELECMLHVCNPRTGQGDLPPMLCLPGKGSFRTSLNKMRNIGSVVS